MINLLSCASQGHVKTPASSHIEVTRLQCTCIGPTRSGSNLLASSLEKCCFTIIWNWKDTQQITAKEHEPCAWPAHPCTWLAGLRCNTQYAVLWPLHAPDCGVKGEVQTMPRSQALTHTDCWPGDKSPLEAAGTSLVTAVHPDLGS